MPIPIQSTKFCGFAWKWKALFRGENHHIECSRVNQEILRPLDGAPIGRRNNLAVCWCLRCVALGPSSDPATLATMSFLNSLSL